MCKIQWKHLLVQTVLWLENRTFFVNWMSFFFFFLQIFLADTFIYFLFALESV